jgi:hypothetical protein
MSNKITIQTKEGNITIDADMLKEYRKRAFAALDDETIAKQDFKDEVEAAVAGVESTTVEGKVLKKILTKYFKASYKEATKEAQEMAELFGAFDEIVGA